MPNVVQNDGAGVWGGLCTCPDGQVYPVGDQLDYCKSLSCFGGTSGVCHKEVLKQWSRKQVTCGKPLKMSEEKLQLLVYRSKAGPLATVVMLGPNSSPRDVCIAAGHAVGPLCFELQALPGNRSVAEGCLDTNLRSMTIGEGQVTLSPQVKLAFHVPLLEPPTPPPPTPPSPPPVPPRIPIPPDSPPAPPGFPPAPPPWQTWPGDLDSAKCDAILRDPGGTFRRMWAAESWGTMGSGS